MNENHVAVGEALASIREQPVRLAGTMFKASLQGVHAAAPLIANPDAAAAA